MASSTTNYSLFTIPAYYLIAMFPHVYGSSLLRVPKKTAAEDSSSKLKPGQHVYNMPNPRGSENPALYSKILDSSTFQRYERSRAAHHNMLESAAFVVSAISAGIITKLPARYMNTMSLLYLSTRMFYTVAYVTTESGIMAYSRTFWFVLGNAVLGSIWWEAGKKIMNGEH